MSLNKELEKITGALCEEAPEGVKYPYKVFSARRMSEYERRQNYVLEINVWDQHQYYSRAESMMDEVEKELHKSDYDTERYYIRIFKGHRENVVDTDKSIKRVREQFEMHVYDKEEN